MALENVLIDKRGRIAIVTINRPDKLNALNVATRKEILAAFEQLKTDDEVRVVVITGAGEKSFIAGADINEFAGMTAIKQRDVMKGGRAFDSVGEFSMGAAYGVGVLPLYHREREHFRPNSA